MGKEIDLHTVTSAFNSKTREKIYYMCLEKERSITEIAETLDLNYAGVWRHIEKLEQLGLIAVRQVKKTRGQTKYIKSFQVPIDPFEAFVEKTLKFSKSIPEQQLKAVGKTGIKGVIRANEFFDKALKEYIKTQPKEIHIPTLAKFCLFKLKTREYQKYNKLFPKELEKVGMNRQEGIEFNLREYFSKLEELKLGEYIFKITGNLDQDLNKLRKSLNPSQ
ncbi:winged helix-turn-helix transcriptional regulator [Candidatus Woesearchaeota archaeon]|nr:winged helix-turn-helix transcriptional regulator [Candidatus Woesearchaeota archaeon]